MRNRASIGLLFLLVDFEVHTRFLKFLPKNKLQEQLWCVVIQAVSFHVDFVQQQKVRTSNGGYSMHSKQHRPCCGGEEAKNQTLRFFRRDFNLEKIRPHLLACSLAVALAVSTVPPPPMPTMHAAPILLAISRASSMPSAVG